MLVILAFIGVRFALHVSRQSGRALANECYTRKCTTAAVDLSIPEWAHYLAAALFLLWVVFGRRRSNVATTPST
ncbi:unnamed protein product [Colias eurytheme]|nr:unnamed protein product [Colias eurytheme]